MTTKAKEVILTVKFEDGQTATMTIAQVNKLTDRRRYNILNYKGEVVFKKTFRGI